MKYALPDACIGCPFYKYKDQEGNGFVPDTLVSGSAVMFIAQNPSINEVNGRKLRKRHWLGYGEYTDEYDQVKPAPLLGATGQNFNTKFLPLTGLKRNEVSIGNAIRCHPHLPGLKADELPSITNKMHLDTSKADAVVALRHCKQHHLKIPESVTTVVTMGTYPLFQLTGQSSVLDWRGYGITIDRPTSTSTNTADVSYYHPLVLDDQDHINVFATVHIAALYKPNMKKYYHATLQDFAKVKRLLLKSWPLHLPAWFPAPPQTWPSYAAFDTEYTIDTGELIRWSLCDTKGMLYCVEAFDSKEIPIQEGSTVLMQNALADISHLSTIVDMTKVKIEDLMLAHSVLWTGEPHSLNYIASIYGAFNRYKHLSMSQEQLYSALDAYEPMHIWRHNILPEFKKDMQSWQVYKRFTLPLVGIINKAQQTGVRLNAERLNEAYLIIQHRVHEIQQRARQLTGDVHFNIGGSKRVKELIYAD